jgi:dynein intermediate chain
MSGSEDMKALREKRSRELAEKKKRLEDLRKKKAEARAGAAAAAPAAAAPAANDGAFDEYINSVLESTAPAGAAKAESEAAAAAAETAAADSAAATPAAAPRAPVNLSVSTMCVINIPSRTAECYEKGTQTMETEDDEEEGVVLQASPEKAAIAAESSGSNAPQAGVSEREEVKPAEMSAEEKKAQMEDATFQDFVGRSSLIIERALGQASAYDILVDYSGTEDADATIDANNAVKQQLLFNDKSLCLNRTVTDMGFSPFHKELLLVSYNARSDGGSDWNWQSSSQSTDQQPDGLVLVWSLLMNSRPEFVFTCQSAVLTAQFDPFDPKLIVGGTYSGQVVLWDTRAKSSPVQQTPLSAKGHTHPIYSMTIVGTQNAHSLVSASTDGKMCVWGTGQLTQPTDTLMLKQTIAPTDSITSSISSGKEREVDVVVTAMSFPESESNNLCIGAEDGTVFQAQIHGGKAGIVAEYPSHHAPVTSMHHHPHNFGHAQGLEDLLLTSSVDWSCKLWSHKLSDKPLLSFEQAHDYIYDARWSPTHPALFATADGSGHLDLWNLNQDTEIATVRTVVEEDRSLSTARWSTDGRKVAVGDSIGNAYIYDVKLEVANPRSDEAEMLERKLAYFADS